MTQRINCCRDCVYPKRHPGCHAKCEEYIAERKALDEVNEKASEGRRAYQQGVEVDLTGIYRAKRLKGKW